MECLYPFSNAHPNTQFSKGFKINLNCKLLRKIRLLQDCEPNITTLGLRIQYSSLQSTLVYIAYGTIHYGEKNYSIPAPNPLAIIQTERTRSWVMIDDVTQLFTNAEAAFLLLQTRDLNPFCQSSLNIAFYCARLASTSSFKNKINLKIL